MRTSKLVSLAWLFAMSLGTGLFAEDLGASMRPRLAHRASSLHGVARPKRFATLRFLTSGAIASVQVDEGEWVREGQPLVTLDDRLAKARLRLAEVSAGRTGELDNAAVQLKYGEKQLARLAALHARSAVSDLELDEQRAMVETARAAYRTQLETIELAKVNRSFVEEQLRLMTVFAPFEGIVTQIHEKLGVSVDPDVPIVSIANLDQLQVEMHTPVDLYGAMRAGDAVRLRAGEPVDSIVRAEVLSVSPVVNAASGTFRCLLQIQNTEVVRPAGFSVTWIRQSEVVPASVAR